MGPGAQFMKRDLKDAFRHIPVVTSDQWLLGFYCDGCYWMERFLPFGLRTAPFLFDLFTKALNWILIAVLGWTIVLHYLDDFFGILSPHADAGAFANQFDQVCSDLGLAVNHSKDILVTITDFLGIEFDSTRMQARLPPDKLARARNTVKYQLNRATISHHELESAVGFHMTHFTTRVRTIAISVTLLQSSLIACKQPLTLRHDQSHGQPHGGKFH